MEREVFMCCDVCPYYEECDELGKTTENCCPECPDYEDCMGSEDLDEDWEEYDE
jgi:hypothetical protein